MRILVAEDEPLLQDLLRRGLALEGFVVDVVDNGIDAEYKGTHEFYDALLLDLGLPKRSGIDVLKNLRGAGIPIPVIILTGQGAWHEKVEGLKVGSDDYLAKPFHMEELVARLNALIRRVQSQSTGLLKVNGITLNENTQSATTTDGKVVELTGIEFRVLKYFMLRPGRVLSKSMLTEQAYDSDSDKNSNVIEVYINRLRHKFGKECITTHRGEGYVFGKDSTTAGVP